jgi:pimeloyl-ACP methyl ester carboxylesterase
MRTELVSIPTPTHPLDGAYYTPEGPSKGAAMYCHGNQMNFYVCAARFLAPHLTGLGYEYLAFNRRGHDSVSTCDSRECVGGAYQTVAEGIEDNELAAKFLSTKGFASPIVIGHSNGGVLASEHVANHPETQALIMLSAHAGGNRLTNPSSARNFSIAGNVEEQKNAAETLVAAGKPRQPDQRSGSRGQRQANQVPGVVYSRRPRAERNLPGGKIRRKLRGPLRSSYRPQLRPLLRRRRRSSLEDRDGLVNEHGRIIA